MKIMTSDILTGVLYGGVLFIKEKALDADYEEMGKTVVENLMATNIPEKYADQIPHIKGVLDGTDVAAFSFHLVRKMFKQWPVENFIDATAAIACRKGAQVIVKQSKMTEKIM